MLPVNQQDAPDAVLTSFPTFKILLIDCFLKLTCFPLSP